MTCMPILVNSPRSTQYWTVRLFLPILVAIKDRVYQSGDGKVKGKVDIYLFTYASSFAGLLGIVHGWHVARYRGHQVRPNSQVMSQYLLNQSP